MAEEMQVMLPDDYEKFVTKLGSKYSMGDFNAKLGTTALGLGGEIGEIAILCSQICLAAERESGTARFCIHKDHVAKLTDELSDLMWYVTFGAANVVQVSLKDIMIHNDKVDRCPHENYLAISALREDYLSLAKNCGFFVDYTKKLLYHGKVYDNQSNGKLCVFLKLIVDSINKMAVRYLYVDIQHLINCNVKKLSARYKSLEFTTEEFLAKEAAKTD
jgi:hypothetical protein